VIGLDLSVYMAMLAFVGVTGLAAWVIANTTDAQDPDTRRIRFAAATFTGLMMLMFFVTILWFTKPDPGKEIFSAAMAVLSPLAGVMVGYLFGASRASNPPADADKRSGDRATSATR